MSIPRGLTSIPTLVRHQRRDVVLKEKSTAIICTGGRTYASFRIPYAKYGESIRALAVPADLTGPTHDSWRGSDRRHSMEVISLNGRPTSQARAVPDGVTHTTLPWHQSPAVHKNLVFVNGNSNSISASMGPPYPEGPQEDLHLDSHGGNSATNSKSE